MNNVGLEYLTPRTPPKHKRDCELEIPDLSWWEADKLCMESPETIVVAERHRVGTRTVCVPGARVGSGGLGM